MVNTESEYDLYNWAPLSPEEVYILLNGLSVPWWIAGGWAIDLHVGTHSRRHLDTDVLVLRKDQFKVQEYLFEWDLFKTGQPGLKPWPRREFLHLGVNDVWCRRTPKDPWSLQLMFMELDRGNWVFRRDDRISGPLDQIGMRTASDLPYVSPQVQLLFKSNNPNLDRNKWDFENISPLLKKSEKAWLLKQFELLYPEGHPWLLQLSDPTPA